MKWINEQDDYPELLQDLADKLAAMLASMGVDSEQAAQLGQEAAEFIRQEWGGQQIYVPKGVVFEHTKQHIEIWDEYKKGAEVEALARKHRLSQQAVYLIIRKMRTRQHDAQQPGLFDTLKGG